MDENEILADAHIKVEDLINACSQLSVIEQRLILVILNHMKEDTSHLLMAKINIDTIADFCHFKSNNRREQVIQLSIRLMEQVLSFDIPTGRYHTHWIQSMLIPNDQSRIEYELDHHIKEELFQMRQHFSVMNLNMAMLLRSKYSFYFYDTMLNALDSGHKRYLLSDLVQIFELTKAYQSFANIRARVIEPAIKEINELSEIAVDSPQYEKQGRKYVAVNLTFHKKN